ncbi:MAG: hypothetical protein QW304_08915 [Thermoproteota archaeon]
MIGAIIGAGVGFVFFVVALWISYQLYFPDIGSLIGSIIFVFFSWGFFWSIITSIMWYFFKPTYSDTFSGTFGCLIWLTGIPFAIGFVFLSWYPGKHLLGLLMLIPCELVLGIIGASWGSAWEASKQLRPARAELRRCEREIAILQQRKEDYSALLYQKDELEKEISKLTSQDPQALCLKREDLEGSARQLQEDALKDRINAIGQELNRLESREQETNSKLKTQEKERDTLQDQLKKMGWKLEALKQRDPQTVLLAIRAIEDELKGLSLEQLKKIKKEGYIDNLFLQIATLRESVKVKENELEQTRRELNGINLSRSLLLIEKNVLMKESVELQLEGLEHIEARLKELHAKRQQLEKMLKEAGKAQPPMT